MNVTSLRDNTPVSSLPQRVLVDNGRLADESKNCRSIEAEINSQINKLSHERKDLLKEVSKGKEVRENEKKLIKLERKIIQLENYLVNYKRKSDSKQDRAIQDVLYRTHCDDF